MKKALFVIVSVGIALAIFLAFTDYSRQNELLFFGGDVLTMDDSQPNVEAVFVKDGKIIAVGAKDSLMQLVTTRTQVIDLKGKTLMPGFFDPHGHYDLAAIFYSMHDVSGVLYRDQEAVWSRIEAAVANAKKNEWVYCYGFDPILTEGIRTPNLKYLDSIAPHNPVVILTKALHVFYVNSKALAELNITQDTPNPSAASYYERDENGQLTGAFVEQEALEPVRHQIQKDVMANFALNTKSIMNEYAKMGVTSAVNMGITANSKALFMLYEHLAASESKPLYRLLALIGKLPERSPNPRLFLYLRKENIDQLSEISEKSDDFYKTIGVKMWYDGSPYSGSMYLRQPYIRSQFTIEGINLAPEHRSHSLLKPRELQEWIEKIQDKGYPVAIHAQGDLANDEVIDVFQKIHENGSINKFRHRIEHCMLLPKARLEAMAAMTITPSFHINHLLFYGEFLNKEILGEERVNQIFPVQSTVDQGLPYTLHADMPQFVPNPLVLASTSINRTTEKGNVFNPNERVTVLDALKSITIHAAWQLHMDDKLGSIVPGKYADFVILDSNPLQHPTQSIGEIKVLETIVAGNTVWKK